MSKIKIDLWEPECIDMGIDTKWESYTVDTGARAALTVEMIEDFHKTLTRPKTKQWILLCVQNGKNLNTMFNTSKYEEDRLYSLKQEMWV